MVVRHRVSRVALSFGVAGAVLGGSAANAAVVTKAGTGTELRFGDAWVGGQAQPSATGVPVAGDTALFDSTANAAQQLTHGNHGGLVSGSASYAGVRVTNVTAPLSIVDYDTTWTLGDLATGVTVADYTIFDLSSASQDLTITANPAASSARGIRLSSDVTANYVIDVASGRTLTLGSNINVFHQTGSRTLQVIGGGNADIAANIIQNGNINLGLTVNSSGGVVTLSGANTYNRDTTVTAGTLYVNGTHANGNFSASTTATGPGNYTVASGATLGGTGTVTFSGGSAVTPTAKTVTVNGTIAPGSVANAIESLAFLQAGGWTADVILGGNANFDINLTNDAFDELIVGNALTYGGTLNVALTGVDAAGGIYDLFDFASQSGTFGTINVTGLGAGQSADFNYATGELSILVPEPTSIALLGIGGLLCVRRRKV